MPRVKNDCCCCSKENTPGNRRLSYESYYSNPPLLGPSVPPFTPSSSPVLSELTTFGQPDTLGEPRYFLPVDFFGPFIESDEEEDVGGGGGPVLGVDSSYTPTYSEIPSLGVGCYDAMSAATVSAGYRHDPDGITWIPLGTWPTWDGVTTLNPCTHTAAEITEWVWPSSGSGWQMRGLREEFYSDPPFADNLAPTVVEIESWHIRVIALYRKLLGVTLTVSPSRELYYRAHWNDERKWSTFWDTAYPGTLGSAYGPCVGMSPYNAHCGATFLPNCPAQEPYLRTGDPCIVDTGGGAEEIFGGEYDWPWAIKLSRVMRNAVQAEGIFGHAGPFLRRPFVGMSFYCDGANFTVRMKWNGTQVDPCP